MHGDRWHEQNIILNGDVLSRELDGFFTCDTYRLAHQNEASLWVAGDEFVGAVGRKGVSAETLFGYKPLGLAKVEL